MIKALANSTFFIIAALFFSTSAKSEPIYTSSECKSLYSSPHHAGSNVIYYYIEQDLGYELRACTPSPNDNGDMANYHAFSAIKAAAEKWNMYSRGTAFVYAGTFSADDPSSICSNTSTYPTPSLFIHFRPGCQPNGQGGCAGSWATFNNLSCAGSSQIRIWGDPDGAPNDPNSCGSDSSTNNQLPFDWEVSSNSDFDSDLESLMMHELGHALNFAHPTATSQSVMVQGTVSRKARHLYPYDKDCVDESHMTDGRAVEYHWFGATAFGPWTFGVQHRYSDDSSRGILGGTVRNAAGNPTHSLYYDSYVRYGAAGTDGDIYYPSVSSIYLDFPERDVSPEIFTPWEFASGNDFRAHYLHHGDDKASQVDPPSVKLMRSDDFLLTEVESTLSWCAAMSGGLCLSYETVSSHVPLRSAWDPVSGKTIFARVQTFRGSGDDGVIKIHPGFYSGQYDVLAQSESFRPSAVPSLPSESYAGWGWQIETEMAPAIACTDDSVSYTFNCLLAWHDRGVPDGRILYTYFRVGSVLSSGRIDIEWQGTAEIVPYSRTVSHISAAFFDGQFQVAWKEWDSSTTVNYTRTSSGPFSWTSPPNRIARVDVVDPPTYQFEPDDSLNNFERSLVWTQSP